MRLIQVCVGSSCFLKGSYAVLDTFTALLRQHGLEKDVRIAGAFCMEHCRDGVSVSIDDIIYSVPDAESANQLFCRLFLANDEAEI